MIAAITGLAAIMNASAVAFQSVKWLGVTYLLYLAWQAIRDRSAIGVTQETPQRSSGQLIRTAVLINLLNPKLTIFFFAFLPQFVAPDSTDSAWRMVTLSLVFMGLTFVVFTLYATFAATMRTHVISRPRVLTWVRRTFATTYVLLAGRLALESR